MLVSIQYSIAFYNGASASLTSIHATMLQPVESLFQTLWNSALAITSRGQTPWTEQLPAQYHTFAGNYHALPVSDSYRFEVVKEEEEEGFSPVIRILMAPPVSRDTAEPSFFNADDYSKHLIGMVSGTFF